MGLVELVDVGVVFFGVEEFFEGFWWGFEVCISFLERKVRNM